MRCVRHYRLAKLHALWEVIEEQVNHHQPLARYKLGPRVQGKEAPVRIFITSCDALCCRYPHAEIGAEVTSSAMHLILKLTKMTLLLGVLVHAASCGWYAIGISTPDGCTTYPSAQAQREHIRKVGV